MIGRGLAAMMSLIVLSLNFSACAGADGGLPEAGDEVRIFLPEPHWHLHRYKVLRGTYLSKMFHRTLG